VKLFKEILTESKDLAKSIADAINTFTDRVGRDTDNFKVCHEAVELVKNRGQNIMAGRFLFYKQLEFFVWNENNWQPLEKYIKQDKTWQRIKVKPFQNLVGDIAGLDGMPTVNGHSFLKWKKFYIDPYMDSAGVSFQNIQKIGKWFERALKSI
jgi:hypothetical protein